MKGPLTVLSHTYQNHIVTEVRVTTYQDRDGNMYKETTETGNYTGTVIKSFEKVANER